MADEENSEELYPRSRSGRNYRINWMAVRDDYSNGRFETLTALAEAHGTNYRTLATRIRKDKERGLPWTRSAVVLPIKPASIVGREKFEPIATDASVGEKAAAMLLRDIELGLEMREAFQEEMRKFRRRPAYGKPNLEAQALFNMMESYAKMAAMGREIAGRLKGQASVRPEDEAAAEAGKEYVVAIIPEGLGEEEKTG